MREEKEGCLTGYKEWKQGKEDDSGCGELNESGPGGSSLIV